jgi:anti-anti-sigma factor
MNALKVNIKETQQGCFLVMLDGPMDTYTHQQFDFYMERILQSTTKSIILDMSKVNYISSMGVGSLFKIRKFAKQHQVALYLVSLQDNVKKVLETVQAMPPEGIFKSIKEMDEYLDSLQKQKPNQAF